MCVSLVANTALATIPTQAQPDRSNSEIGLFEAGDIDPTGGPFIIKVWNEIDKYRDNNPTIEVCNEATIVELKNDGVAPDAAANDEQFSASAVACANGDTPVILYDANGIQIFQTVVSITRHIESPSLNIYLRGGEVTSNLSSDVSPEEPVRLELTNTTTNNSETEAAEPTISDPLTDKILAILYVGIGLVIGGIIGWKANKSEIT